MTDEELIAVKVKRNENLDHLDRLLNDLLQLQDQITVVLNKIEGTRKLIAIYNEALTSAPRTP